MARYLILITLAALAACNFSTRVAEPGAAEYPETKNDTVRVTSVNAGGDTYVPPGMTQAGLAGFERYASASDGVRARSGEFEVLYQAPNRHPEVAAPYQPALIQDRLMIMRAGQVLADEAIPAEFAGTTGSRRLDVAEINAGAKRFLVVTTRNDVRNPVWLAVFSSNGNLLYRAALPHGGVRFVEHADGLSMLDQAGHGKRITLL